MLIYSDVGFYYLLLYLIRHYDRGIITSAQAKVSELVEHDLLQENCIHEMHFGSKLTARALFNFLQDLFLSLFLSVQV